MADRTESEMAREMARFLTEPRTVYFDGRNRSVSPLQEYLQEEIRALAGRIATEVVATVPDLHDLIREHTQTTLQQVLRDDAWIGSTVTRAVSEAISKRIRSGDDDG